MTDLDDTLKSGDLNAARTIIYQSKQVIGIDFQIFHDEMIDLIDAAIEDDELVGEFSMGMDWVKLNFKDREKEITISNDWPDTVRLLDAICEVLAPDYELRYIRDEFGYPEPEVLLRPVAWWVAMDEVYPGTMSSMFAKIEPTTEAAS
jgi:hypothetical protein